MIQQLFGIQPKEDITEKAKRKTLDFMNQAYFNNENI